MKYHKIEIDEEVHRYLVGKIQDFNDTPNSILRRELLQKKGEKKEFFRSNYQLPKISDGSPVALQQILEVIYLVKSRGFSRVEATKSVAKRHRVRRETVLDKYGRQLNKSTSEVDRLLEDQNLNEFKMILKRKFSDQTSVIENFFKDLSNNVPIFSEAVRKIERKENPMLGKHISLDILETQGTDLLKTKPASVLINEDKYEIDTWTDLDITVVKWLIEHDFLDRSNLPIYATKNKYFLNTQKVHTSERFDGKWNEVDKGIYIDSKFNAPNHIRNILKLIDQLSIKDQCKIKLQLR